MNLAPADIVKSGSALDLPIALGILVASGQVSGDLLDGFVALGEVGLEGDLRPVRGALSMALRARVTGCKGVILPSANLAEASVAEGIEVLGADTLMDVCDWLDGRDNFEFSDVKLNVPIPAATFGQPDVTAAAPK